ncbi:MAG: hypothetical protein AABZ80_08185 [Gemmatimonadota bacterium]
MPPSAHPWEFKRRFRRHAFGWKGSRAAIQRIDEAVREIRNIARTDPVTAADGAVAFIERLSPALDQIDSSSGAIGSAVNDALANLVPLIAAPVAGTARRTRWLECLWDAHEADDIPYIEGLTDYWGELCASRELASEWADQLVGITRHALSPDPSLHGHFHGTTACFSALFSAQRYDEIVDMLRVDTIWPYKRWAVKAMVARGEKAEAIRYAESCRGPWTPDGSVDRICEEILLSSGLVDEAYARYGLSANRRGKYLATFRAVAEKYPGKPARQILADLVATMPGEEGKWFAAAKEAGFYDEALALARRSPCDPKTLTRAARDHAARNPAFAVGAGLLALRWLVHGYGYEITGVDVLAAYSNTMKAAQHARCIEETREAVKLIVSGEEGGGGRFVRQFLGKELGL